MAEPDSYEKTVKGSKNKELTRSQIGRYDFWTKMNDYITDNKVELKTRKPSYDHWYDFAMGNTNYHLSVNLLDSENKIRIYWWGKDSQKLHFDRLHKHKVKIDEELSAFGELEWDRKDEAKASWIAVYIDNFSFDNSENWSELFPKIAERIKKINEVLKEYL